MTNESVVKMLEELIVKQAAMLVKCQALIMESGETLDKARNDLRDEQPIPLQVGDEVIVNGLKGYFVYWNNTENWAYGAARFLVEFDRMDGTDGTDVIHDYFKREDIHKC